MGKRQQQVMAAAIDTLTVCMTDHEHGAMKWERFLAEWSQTTEDARTIIAVQKAFTAGFQCAKQMASGVLA